MPRFISLLLFVIACLILYLYPSSVAGSWIALALGLLSGALFLRNRPPESQGALNNNLQQSNAGRQQLQDSQSERILKATMSGMREGVVVVDESMKVIASNNAAHSIFPRFDSGLESLRLSELTRNKALYNAFRDVVEKGEYAEAKVEMLDRERRVFDLRVVPLRLGDETQAQGAMGVFFDITQLERLERVRQEFLSNVSHELRTPLTAIIAFVETLEDGAIDDEENNVRFLGVIRKNAERMRNLIDDILDLSAIEAGNVAIEAAELPLSELVNEISTALSSRATERGVTIRNEVEEGVLVYADHRRLEQMLTNLMDNAVKFNREGGTVTVTYERGEKDRIQISDTGDGIAPEHIARIFERFYRIDRARSREMGGTGLGLAIVKHLGRLHGGEVSVQSEIGEGSTFLIDLPCPSRSFEARGMEPEKVTEA